MDKILFEHNFTAELLKQAKPSNVDIIEYCKAGLGLVQINVRFIIREETLDKTLKEWYDNAGRN